MFVIGIDPGVSRLGYCVLEPQSSTKATALAMGVIRTSVRDPLPSRLAEIQTELRSLYAEFPPTIVAIEAVFFQVNVRTAMSVGQASGIAIAEGASVGAEVVQYTPNEVKLAVAGDGGAGKEEIQEMVRHLLGLRHTPNPPDAADAAALALCHLAHAPMVARARRAEAVHR